MTDSPFPPKPLIASQSAPPFARRMTVIASGVVALHAAALWTLQAGLLHSPIEVFTPITLETALIEPPRPQVNPPSPPPPPPKTVPRPAVTTPIKLQPPPEPIAVAANPTSDAVRGVIDPPPAPPTPIAAPVAPAPASYVPSPSPPPSTIIMPSSNADYLQNLPPVYPAISRRLNEQGKVTIRVLIGTDGLAQQAELHHSSGFSRLDQTALETVKKWRYVPGRRNGIPATMWFNVPINFVLE